MGSGPGTNTGHGHVWPRPDGMKMRCGGKVLCPACAQDFARFGAEAATRPAFGDQDVEAAYREALIAAVDTLDTFFNGEARGPAKKVGFIVMAFPFNEGHGRCSYMSNGIDRDDVVALMKEQVARFEGRHVEGAIEVRQ